jgi:fused signal recognition particle receptor
MFRKLGFGKKKEKKPTEAGGEPLVAEIDKHEKKEKSGFFARLVKGLARTRKSFVANLKSVLRGRVIDDELMEELEEVMVTADMGLPTTSRIIEEVRNKASEQGLKEAEGVIDLIKESILESLEKVSAPLNIEGGNPAVMLVLGVNGVGKTTTIGKLAHSLGKEGKKVILAAGDTFRAAAIEQLEIWAERAGVDIIKGRSGGDPSAVIYDSIQAARARKCDLVIADTAGRLHTKVNLMEELKKIKRVVGREVEGAPHEVLLVLDATTGQNALSQARMFHDALGVTGIALTKLDGTAKGGVVISIVSELGLPLKLIGIGEKVDDLQPFNPAEYVEALFQDA